MRPSSHALRAARRPSRRGLIVLLACLSSAGSRAGAQAEPACVDAAERPSRATAWPIPLDALVSFRARETTLREALDRLSAASGVPVAYSSTLIPVDRAVCVVAEGQALGRVLTMLLAGTRVEPLVVAGRVVLAPSALTRDSTPPRLSILERVVVTGSAVAAPRRALAMGVEVIDGEQLRREGHTTLSGALDASVPGLWLWDQAPGSLVAQYGGVRGASSFGTSYPKMYIDGIEVANPLLVTQLHPEMVDRIEVIRGPQGSALYGSDAISGVINVVTRHDGVDDEGTRVQFSSTAGASASAFGPSPVPVHDQRLTIRTGTDVRSAGLALEFGQAGAVIPASESRTLSVMGDARAVTGIATLSASARLFDKRAGVGRNPLLAAGAETALAGVAPAAADPSQSVRLYTVASSAAFALDPRWTHTVVAGLDGYRLDNVADATIPFLTGIDSALRAARGDGDRATLRASSVARLGDPSWSATTLTVSVEHSVLRQSSLTSASRSPVVGERHAGTDEWVESWNHNTGALAQASTSWLNSFFLSGGLRLERNDAFSGAERHPLLPLLGAAVVRSFGAVEVKLRSSYGKGIRPPRTAVRGTFAVPSTTAAIERSPTGLDPEVQTGIESGIEVYVGDALSLQATRFDQRATGLIQNVIVGVERRIVDGVRARRMRYQLENVGEIGNRGWELQGTVRRGSLGVAGTLATVDSRVVAVAPGYLGDLRAGDRMLAVPARTASLRAYWLATGWTASMTATRASDWVNYDRVALVRAYAAVDTPGAAAARDLIGWRLRTFWREYDGQTHLRIATSHEVGRGLSLVFSGENLLGGQLGEPDNLTIRAGRSLSGGVRATF